MAVRISYLFIVFAWLMPALAAAQTAPIRNVAVSEFSADFPYPKCETQNPPAPIERVTWVIKPDSALVWCVQGASVEQARAAAYKVYIDDTPYPVVAACQVATGNIPCGSYLPPAAVTALRQSVDRRFSMTATIGGTESPRSATTLLAGPGCRVVDMSKAGPAVLLDARAPLAGEPAIAGRVGELGIRSQAGTQDFMAAVGLLRRNGWAVEWQRSQYTEPSASASGVPRGSADGGYYWLGAWCMGRPQ